MTEWQDENKQLHEEYIAKSKFPGFVPKRLECKFVEITNLGKAVVGFSHDIRIVANLTMINNGTIYLDQIGLGRALSIAEKQRVPILQVQMLPGPDSNSEDLTFTWNVTQ